MDLSKIVADPSQSVMDPSQSVAGLSNVLLIPPKCYIYRQGNFGKYRYRLGDFGKDQYRQGGPFEKWLKNLIWERLGLH